MLAKKDRLSRTEFNRFFAVGKRYHSPSFQIVSVPYPTFHASVVVSKKIAKRAVMRNKIRRRIYDILRHYTKAEALHGVYIVLTKSGVEKRSYHELKEEMHTQLGHIIKK